MFIAGNNADAKNAVTDILTQFGWKSVIDLGGIESARYLEPLAMIWFIQMTRTKRINHAFKLVGKSEEQS